MREGARLHELVCVRCGGLWRPEARRGTVAEDVLLAEGAAVHERLAAHREGSARSLPHELPDPDAGEVDSEVLEWEADLARRGAWLVTGARALAAAHGVSLVQIRGRSRRALVVAARRAVAKWLREVRGWSFVSIGNLLGRDHTSIHHLVTTPNPGGDEPAATTSAPRRHRRPS